MKITLKGNPQSTNNIYKTMCRGCFPTRYMVARGRELKENYQWQIKQQMKGKEMFIERMFTEELEVRIDLFHGTKRKNDWDNFHKLSMDAMSGLVYKDDSQIVKASVLKLYDKSNPRIEIDIKPLWKPL